MKPELGQHVSAGGTSRRIESEIDADDFALRGNGDASAVESERLPVQSRSGIPNSPAEFVRGSGSGMKKKIVISVAASLVLICGGVGGYQLWQKSTLSNAASARQAPPAVTVSTVKAKSQSIDDVLVVTGSVSAWDPLELGSEVSGLRIVKVNVEEGDTVKKGQVLALLNSSLLEAQLAEAKARLTSSEATLKKSMQPNRPEDIEQLHDALDQANATIKQEQALEKEARAMLADAELNEHRFVELAKAGAAAASEADAKRLVAETARQEILNHRAKMESAQSAAEQARQKLMEATRGGRQEDIDISKAVIAQTQAQIQELAVQISQTAIRSPDDGVISKRDAHIGSIASTGTPLFSIIRLNRLELRAQVSDQDLTKFKVGQHVRVTTTEDQDSSAIGTVWLVSPQVDPLSRLGTVRVELPPNAGLKPGMFVRGEVKLAQRQAVTVPVNCVQTRNGESFVFTLDGDRVVSTPVKIGMQGDNYIEIKDGLKAGQEIVAKGARFLSDRDVVRVSQ
jgi:HlyD family secretion protein